MADHTADRTAGRRRASGIYGSIVTAAILTTAGGQLPTLPLAVAVVVTLLVYWTAEEYAELLGEHVADGKLPGMAQISAELRATWPMVTSSHGPVAALLLVRLAGASPVTAANAGLAVAVTLLVYHAWSAARIARLRGPTLIGATCAVGLLGVVMILMKNSFWFTCTERNPVGVPVLAERGDGGVDGGVEMGGIEGDSGHLPVAVDLLPGAHGERRGRGIRPQHEDPRWSEHRVAQQAQDGRVQPGDRRQTGAFRVGHALRHQQCREDDARDDVLGQPAAPVGPDLPKTGDPLGHGQSLRRTDGGADTSRHARASHGKLVLIAGGERPSTDRNDPPSLDRRPAPRRRRVNDVRAKRIANFIEPLRVEPGSKVRLAKDFDPAFKAGVTKKRDGRELLRTGVELLAEYQRRLAAENTRGVLLCLQALDAGGKDGTIRHVMSGVNPQGVKVSSFKVPSAEELDHDYLWRYACRLPARGEIGIFNRSHYEEVLVVRVHQENLDRQRLPGTSAGKNMWARRFREINDWERYLTDNGFAVVKLFLNLSWEEQRARFLKRIDVPDRNWKFSAADIRERRFWKDYQHAFSEMLSATSKPWAPWHVIPADRKWFARLCVGAVLAHTLIELDPQYPRVSAEARDELRKARAELEAEEKPPTAAGGSRRA